MLSAAQEWRRGWKSLTAAFVGMMLVSSVASILGVIMAPVANEFGWSRALVSGSMFVLAILNLLLAPVLGLLIARFGVRRCALASIVAVLPILLLMSRMPDNVALWYAGWFVYGVINVGLGPMVWSSIAASLFDRTRGVALAVMLSSSGVAFFVYPPLCVFIAMEYGWRAIFLVQAGLYGLLLLPLAMLWLRSAQDLLQASPELPDGSEPEQEALPAAAQAEGLSLGEAFRNRQFWQFTSVALLVALAEGGLVVHLFPILSEGGLAATAAGMITALMGLSMIAGRLVIGFMCDRMPGTLAMAFAIAALLLAAIMAGLNSGEMLFGAAISLILGFGAGGMTSGLAYVTSSYFGLKAYATLLGITYGTFGLGFGFAPVIAGHVREHFGTYGPFFAGAAVVLIIAVALMLTLGKPAYRPAAD